MEGFVSWSVVTTNFLMVLYMALAGVTFVSILHLVNGKWRFEVRYYAVSLTALFPLAFVLLIILLANGENTFAWLGQAHDSGYHLNAWHNYTFLVIRQVLGLLVVAGFFAWFIKYQHLAATINTPEIQWKFRNIALVIPFIYVLYGTMVAWDFEMTMIPGWHSASYGAYQFVSMFQAFLALFAIMLFVLNRSGKVIKPIKSYVFNYLAQLMLGFTILWTYFYFTQYLIMWYGRLPEEMDRYDAMMHHDLAPIWWVFLVLKFIFPFITFATWTSNRHNPVVIIIIATGILIGTWLERYTWITGSVDPEHYRLPMTSVSDIAITVIIIGLAVWIIKKTLGRYGLART